MSRDTSNSLLSAVQLLAALCVGMWLVLFLRNAPYPCAIWDDALMFVRYAMRFAQGDGIAWNPGGPHSWGPTSLAYLMVVTPIQLLLGDATRAAGTASVASGLLLVGLLVVLAIRMFPRSRARRLLAISIALASLSLAGNSLAMHLRSGMDTLFAMAYLTGYLIVSDQLVISGGSRRVATLTGAIGGLAFLVRPDLSIYAAVVPVLLATSADPQLRRAAVRAVVVTALVAGVAWALAFAYFRTPLPLAFYVKSLGGQDPEFARLYARIPALQMAEYMRLTAPLWIGVALAAVLNLRATLRNRLDLGLLIATALFILYYRLGVLQIMHYGQRFYFPTLPALIYLAISALRRFLDRPHRRSHHLFHVVGGEVFTSTVALLFLVAAVLCEMQPNDRKTEATVLCPALPPDQDQATIRNVWAGLNLIAQMPNDLSLATTEVGLPAVLSPGHPIVDLSGLNDPAIASGNWSALHTVLATKPDVVYLHPDYPTLNRSFESSPEFTSEYEPQQPNPPRMLAVFVRRNSRYRAEILRALAMD